MINSMLHKADRFDSIAYLPMTIFANTLVEIFEPTGSREDWSVEHGLVRKPVTPFWRGWAAVTPNQNWRARDRQSGFDYTAVHAYQVQLRHIDENELLPRSEWGKKDNRVVIVEGHIIRLVKHPSDPSREGMQLVVRNATTDSDWWQQTMICDVDAGDIYGKTH